MTKFFQFTLANHLLEYNLWNDIISQDTSVTGSPDWPCPKNVCTLEIQVSAGEITVSSGDAKGEVLAINAVYTDRVDRNILFLPDYNLKGTADNAACKIKIIAI